ncbi:MAG: HDIG domain-containing protein [Thermoanaerobaculales bacterium]|jgi:putative nucleotidyltransferase with HDIG domain|nr:HDIG domain-containing protein [Thermoanaerobaculales bacterium]
MLRDEVERIWPELEWIEDDELRERTTRCWERAFELSPLTPADLERIPFTLKVPGCPVTFMAHKRAVVHVARDAARSVQGFFGEALPVDLDTVVAGAILADVGKLLEYESDGAGGSRQSARGKYLRHPFTGVALAIECGLPDAVTHIVATHAGEGNLVARTTEAWLVHHADFMTYEPFVKRLEL